MHSTIHTSIADQNRSGLIQALCAPADFRSAMQKLAGSVCIVTTAHNGCRLGLTMTAVCSLSADPPSLVACVNQNAQAHDLILASGRLCVNVLKVEHVPLSVSFSAGDGSKGEVRFASANWACGITGAPILTEALAHFDCWVVECLQTNTHSIFICHVAEAARSGGGEPLIYVNRQYGQPAKREEAPH